VEEEGGGVMMGIIHRFSDSQNYHYVTNSFPPIHQLLALLSSLLLLLLLVLFTYHNLSIVLRHSSGEEGLLHMIAHIADHEISTLNSLTG